MKRVLSILLALCLLVGVLPMVAGARGINRYTETIQQLIKERFGSSKYYNTGLFYDLDGDGIEEMLIMRRKGKDINIPELYASVYSIVDGEAVCLMKDQYVYHEVGGNNGYMRVLQKSGKTYLGIYTSGGSYGGPHDSRRSGGWNLYQINRATGKLNKTNTASFLDEDRGGKVSKYGTIDGKRVSYAQYEAWVKSFTVKGTVNSDGKYTFESLLRLSKADTTGDLPTTTVGGFKDVFVDSYYAEAVKWAVDNDITSGVSANKFGPAEPCQRQQIVTFLWKHLGRPDPQGIADFTDMPTTEVFRKAISWASETGITSGAGNNRFGSSSGCTRAEAMTFIWRALGKPDPKSAASFTDLPNSPDMQKAISWAAENGITAGAGNNRFGSNQICKREEIVTFLYKANNLQK